MTLENAIRQLLLANSTISTGVLTHIGPSQPGQAWTYPFCLYAKTGEAPMLNMAGPSALVEAEMRLDWYGATDATVQPLATAARHVLHGYMGTVASTSSTADVCSIEHCMLTDSESSSLEPKPGEAIGIYAISQTYSLVYRTT